VGFGIDSGSGSGSGSHYSGWIKMGYLAFATVIAIATAIATAFVLVYDVFLGDRETGLWLALAWTAMFIDQYGV